MDNQTETDDTNASEVMIDLIDRAIPGVPKTFMKHVDNDVWVSVVDSAEDTDAQEQLGVLLSSMAGDKVAVLGVGEYNGRRAPMTIMACTTEARDVAVSLITTLYPDLVMVGQRDLPEDVEEPDDFPIGYYMAWLSYSTDANLPVASNTNAIQVTDPVQAAAA